MAEPILAEACEPASRRVIPVIGDSKVFVGRGLLQEIPAELTPANGIKASKFVIVSDANVWKLYGQQLVSAFKGLGNVKVHDVATDTAKTTPAMDWATGCSCGVYTVESANEEKLLLTYQVAAGECSKQRSARAARTAPSRRRAGRGARGGGRACPGW